jgi:hypothetical protein
MHSDEIKRKEEGEEEEEEEEIGKGEEQLEGARPENRPDWTGWEGVWRDSILFPSLSFSYLLCFFLLLLYSLACSFFFLLLPPHMKKRSGEQEEVPCCSD